VRGELALVVGNLRHPDLHAAETSRGTLTISVLLERFSVGMGDLEIIMS
jgi:hypothetical protein